MALTKLAVLALATASILHSKPADAAVTINITQVGADVVAVANGTLNLAGLTFNSTNLPFPAIMIPRARTITFSEYSSFDEYIGVTGPSAFGFNIFSTPSSSSGPVFGIQSTGINVPAGYTSGSQITAATDIFANKTLAALGLTPGQFTFTVPNDAIQLNIIGDSVVGAVPEPATWAMMIGGFGIVGASMRRRRNKAKVTYA